MSKKTAPKRGNVTMKMRNDNPFLIGSLSHLRKKKEQKTGNTVFRHIKKRTIEVNEKQWEQKKKKKDKQIKEGLSREETRSKTEETMNS